MKLEDRETERMVQVGQRQNPRQRQWYRDTNSKVGYARQTD